MRRFVLAISVAALVVLVAETAHADGRKLHFTLDLGAAIPFGPGLKETTFDQFPDWASSCDPAVGYNGFISICNPAVAGFDAGLAFHFEFPAHVGLGAGYKMTIFGRTADPLVPVTNEENNGDKAPFVAHQIDLLVKLRILDMVRHYKTHKKMGSLDLDLAFGFVRLYGVENFFQLSQTIAYVYPVAPAFAIGIYIGFVEAISLDKRRTTGTFCWDAAETPPACTGGSFETFEGTLNDYWMQMGLRMQFSFLESGEKKEDKGEGFGEGESEYAEQMKLMDSDGDGLSDYSEMMLGTSSSNKDTDGDTLPDGLEDANLNGVRDPGETDPAAVDSDGGGASDGWEVTNGYDPLNFEDDDRDLDGVVDDVDNCPGTVPGAEVGEAGCPTLTEAVILDQVTFVEGTSELNPEAYVQLDQYTMMLLQDPELEVVILVFGPPSGNKKKIQTLTEEQAQAIQDYMVLRGLDEYRITVSGMGKDSDGPRVELQPIIPMF